MVRTEPSYDFIKATAKVGLKRPEDNPWIDIDLSTNNEAFCKYTCSCLNNSILKNCSITGGLEIILKPLAYTQNKHKIIYYIGQCKRCKKIYYTYDN